MSQFPDFPNTSTLLPDPPEECDLCRRVLAPGEEYYHVTLGMDDAPNYAGRPAASSSTVESTSELTVCARCEPQVTAPFNALLEALWGLRAPDLVPET